MHIYCITNLVNGKIYVGQHKGDDLAKYLRRKRNDKSCSRIYGAINKYGLENFRIQSLVRPIDKQQMDALEEFFIRTLDSQKRNIGYNIAAGGEGGNVVEWTEERRKAAGDRQRGKTRNPETVKKIADANRGKVRPNITAALTGVPRPDVSELNKIRFKGVVPWNKKYTEEEKKEKHREESRAYYWRKKNELLNLNNDSSFAIP